ncbi:hypothetical protein Cylst_6569 (plasmid) [Cylindrospermum stagnale PCC 7417]|uniref:Uncharacterized protein n=1 Tax=Cylindrospermum stagnale PCC 7417 TaxID=56107 RepID=K9X8B0_9NOST|nr:hypothetical protein Cylst_6569 [Cylindrospermum stagnale PCC 7417]
MPLIIKLLLRRGLGVDAGISYVKFGRIKEIPLPVKVSPIIKSPPKLGIGNA